MDTKTEKKEKVFKYFTTFPSLFLVVLVESWKKPLNQRQEMFCPLWLFLINVFSEWNPVSFNICPVFLQHKPHLYSTRHEPPCPVRTCKQRGVDQGFPVGIHGTTLLHQEQSSFQHHCSDQSSKLNSRHYFAELQRLFATPTIQIEQQLQAIPAPITLDANAISLYTMISVFI